MIDTELTPFCEKHGIRVLDTNKRAHVYHKINLDYFRDPDNFDIIQSHTNILRDSEPLYTIEIAESELRKISEFEDQVFNNMKTYGPHHYQMFEAIMKQKQEERYLRDKYPAVKKAFQQYSLMLKLAESGEL